MGMINLAGYENVNSLHEGEDLTLFRAIRSYDDIPVLIKYPNSKQPSPRILSGLKNEFAASQEIGNNGIIQTVSLHRTDNSLALILEDKDYQLLGSLVRNNETDLRKKIKLAIKIAKSMEMIHSKGFLHRNIRPQSIAVSGDLSEAVLTNLQFSSRISDSYSGGGTSLLSDENITYISPEQSGRISGELDRRSDFYSLGVTFFELFTGRPPFIADDALELIHSHLAKEPPVPYHLNPEIPESVSAVILKLLAKNPGDRYQSAHGIIQDLKACLRIIKNQEPPEGFTVGNQDISDTFTLSRRLFGRKDEIKLLQNSYNKVSLGSCEIIVVRGEPGCGKTTLVQAIRKKVIRDRGEFISGKFDQFRRNRPYSAIIQAFQEILRKRMTSPAPVINAWEKRITDALGQNAGLITEVIPELEQLIGPQKRPHKLPSAESRNRFNLTFKNFIKVFPSMDKPLVLFLDDLQWADPATIHLIKRLLEDNETSYLMLITAYRTNHPLDKNVLSMLTEIEELNSNAKTITLDKLKLRHVHGFISRTLRSDRKSTEELAKLVYNRTGGNPLFVREYLRNLHRGKFIEFNYTKNRWDWDLKAIRNISIDGNIVELMADKIMSQPLEGQDILKAASCIGGKFDLRILMAVTDILDDVVINYMNLALQEGLIVSDEDSDTHIISLENDTEHSTYLSFMHDRVQQAAYSMLNAAEKNKLHLRIGRAMLEIYNDSEINDLVFEIATQYNFSINEITDEVERTKVSDIFLKAGRKAKRSSAFELATKYFATASRLMDTDSWSTHYQEFLDLHLDWFECNYLSGATKHSEQIFKTIIAHAMTRNDLAKANLAKIQLYFDQSRYHEAVKLGLKMLELYKMHIPIRPGNIAIRAELIKTKLILRNKTADTLLDLPEMSDPDHQETMRLLMYTIAPAYMFNKKLVFFMILKMIQFSVKHGNAPSSAFGYMFYAMFLAAKDFSFNKSKEFTRLAVDLNNRFNNSELETKINMLRGAMHDHWHEPLARNVSTLEKAFQTGLLHGDNAYARYSGYFAVYYKFLQGGSIADVYDSSEKFAGFIRKNKNSLSSGALNLALQMCKSMEGKTYTPGYLDDDTFQEAKLIAVARSSGSEVVEYWTGLSKIITLSLFNYHAKALEYIDYLYDTLEQTLFGMYVVPIFHFFSIINMSAEFEDAAANTQKEYSSRINASLSKLEKWQNNCPDNFRHLYLIAKAENSRLTGKMNEAIYLYEEGIRSCIKIDSNIFAALACELAARFHFTIGGKRSGMALLAEACQYYRRWGATAKVQRLMHDHRLLQNSLTSQFTADESEEQSGASKTNYSLDISAVVKASQAISGEIVLDRLLDKLMRIVIENAGAQKATLLLNNKNALELTAHAFVSKHGITTRVKPESNQELYCKSIVNYVLRSKDNIVLRDAGAQGPFTIDSYIIRTKPKSILAMPVVNQQIMRGVLYLENNLSPGVFTEDRLEVLNLLCSQAAISIQNARLYSDLRDSETQHRTLLENINVGAFRAEADLDGRLLKGNRALAEMFGYHSWNEFKMTPIRSLYVNPKLYHSILNDLADGAIIRDREVKMRRQDGTPIWVNMTASLHQDGSERENCIEGVFEDVTEKRKAQELERAKVAADAANKAKSDFLASMSHEIRTPMNAILGMADMLWESRLSKVQRNYVKLFKNAGENLLLLINDILDLSKIEAGQITLEAIDFNLEDLFEEIGSIFALRAQAKKIDFCWYISPQVPKIITGDPTRIRQIIVNLVGNALKFTKSGTITYEAGLTQKGLLRIIIKDTGLGIPKAKMNTVFDTFSQADSSTTRNFGGTGLGLSICSRMVTSMKGGLFVSSEEGKGSSFAFTIRIEIPIQPKRPLPLKNTSILMVDQKHVCRDFLEQSLKDIGAAVYVAEDFSRAAAKAAEMSLANAANKVLVVGIPAGEDDRFEVLKKLKRDLCKNWKLIMIMQAKPEPRATSRAKQLGASYVHKPVHSLAIAEIVKDTNTDYIEQVEPVEIICKEEPVNKIENTNNSILLVEDSEDNRMVIDLFLKKSPYNIDYAMNGKEGLEKFIAGEYSIILMDIQMPVMDGYEATKAIREYEKKNNMQEIPILALTANAFQEDEQKCLECGCTAHMAKPVKKKKLLKTLEELLPSGK
ncbi:PAS sensor protein [Maridesulfovibrio hydrothermalis AM13 = DSM 14728]|uniref:Sensory/regulatory protein RpfC n=2 Tax=Maridesulfovibrio TaxID=2794998 RepID=L0R9I6_9BACT|nr:PAS sensor protein [Maridesulfovibrio hydrothermalis AM13 = DSM 14728]